MDLVANSADLAALSALRELPEASILVFDQELCFVLAAGQALDREEHPSRWREGQFLGDAFPAEQWTLINPLCRSALEGETRSREIWTEEKKRCLMVDVGPLRVDNGKVAGGVAVILDITARRRADEALLDSKERFEQVFERAPIGMGLLDQEGKWILVNRALCEITGYTSDELLDRRFRDITHPEDVDSDIARVTQLLAGEILAYQIEKRYFNAAGEMMSAMLSMSLVRDRHGEPLHFIAQVQDISERKQLEERLRHLADHDPLTGLRNRRLFEQDLNHQVGRCKRYGEHAALMVIDLDNFKQINDRYGHKVGDDTLKAVAKALTRRLRTTDLLARLGGDEFAVLLPHIDADGSKIVLEGLVRVIGACSIDVGDTVVHPGASIGVALIDTDAVDDEAILVTADQAMYKAKQAKAKIPPTS